MQEKNKQLVLHLNIFADSCPQIWLQVFLRMRHTSVVCKNKIEYNSGFNGIEKWFLTFDVTWMLIVFDNIDRLYKMTIVYIKC